MRWVVFASPINSTSRRSLAGRRNTPRRHRPCDGAYALPRDGCKRCDASPRNALWQGDLQRHRLRLANEPSGECRPRFARQKPLMVEGRRTPWLTAPEATSFASGHPACRLELPQPRCRVQTLATSLTKKATPPCRLSHIGVGGTRTPAPVHVNPRPGFSGAWVPPAIATPWCRPPSAGRNGPVPLGWDPPF
jgi:hypothetical protein